MLISSMIFSQEKPQQIKGIAESDYTNDWYKKQMGLWQKEVQKDQNNAEAWYNYFRATRYANINHKESKEVKNLLKRLVDDMGKHVPDSYQYLYLSYFIDNKNSDFSLLERSFELSGRTFMDAVVDLLIHYELNDNASKKKELCLRILQDQYYLPGVLDYNYNLLMSCEKAGILFNYGDMETFPSWALQNGKNIGADLSLINLSLIKENLAYFELKLKNKGINIASLKLPDINDKSFISSFCKAMANKYPQIPIYFSIGLPKEYYQNFSEKLYLTGLAYKYSENRLDNELLLKDNVESRFVLDFLKTNDWNEQLPGYVKRMNTNYLTAFIKLVEYYYNNNKVDNLERINKYRELAYKIAADISEETRRDLEAYFEKMGLSPTSISTNIKNKSPYFVYPNPTKDILCIKLNDNSKLRDVIIYDIQGKRQAINNTNFKENNEINISHLASGQYIVVLNVDGKVFSEHIIVQ